MRIRRNADSFLVAILSVVFMTSGVAKGQNIVTNPSFASNISGWAESTDTDHVTWSSVDIANSSSSGSMWLFAIGSADTIEVAQCVTATHPGPGALINIGGSVYMPSSDAGAGEATVGVTYYTGASCSGSPIQVAVLKFNTNTYSKDNWHTQGPAPFSWPASSSMEVFVRVVRNSGSAFSAHFDNIIVEPLTPPPPASEISVFGPTDAKVNEYRRFRAVGENCDGDTQWYWNWSAPGGLITTHGAHDIITVHWPSPGTYTVTATHPNCGSASGSRTVTVANRGPYVWVWPGAPYMFEPAGTDLARTGYTVFNWGDESTTITMDQEGDFFSQSPMSFTLEPRGSQSIDLRGNVAPAGLHRGRSFVLGAGVPPSLDEGQLVQMYVFETESSAEAPEPETTRIDTKEAGPQSVRFDNRGTVPIDAIVSADQPWIVPASNEVTIPAGGSATVDFTIDRSRRPDADAPLGSVSGSLILSQSAGSTAKRAPDPTTAQGEGITTTLVTVVDTAPPPASESGIPALTANEVALFVPGVGHVLGSVGTFISDLSFVNLDLFDTLNGIDLYFNPMPGSPGTGSQKSSLASLAPNQPIALADIVDTVFDSTTQLGSLQLRAASVDALGITATVFNKTNPAGTYGTTIPVFRSDRGAGAGESFYLAGLLSSESSHTNVYIQEVSGSSVTVATEFLGESGNIVSSRSDTVPGFALIQLVDVVPEGAVSAVLSHGGGTGKFAAYATPVDDLSGDTWAVSDWPQQLGYSRSEPSVIPVAGALRGANETFFRTDAAIMNSGSTMATGTLRYYDQSGPIYEEDVSLTPTETKVLDNITETLFGITAATVGYMTLTPSSGEMVITSRNFTTEAGGVATYGSGVPTLAASSALDAGHVTRFGGIADAGLATINDGAPATFRTNLGLVETAGEPTTVRVTIRFDIPGTLASARGVASKDYPLGARQFLLIRNVARAILGDEREEILGDLANLELEFEHVAGTGRAVVFASSVDNGTGDSILTAR